MKRANKQRNIQSRPIEIQMSDSSLKFIVTVTVITFVLVLRSGHTILFELPAMHRGRFTNRWTEVTKFWQQPRSERIFIVNLEKPRGRGCYGNSYFETHWKRQNLTTCPMQIFKAITSVQPVNQEWGREVLKQKCLLLKIFRVKKNHC